MEEIKGYCEDCSWLMDTVDLGVYCFLSLNDVKYKDYCSFFTADKVDYKSENVAEGDDSEEYL